MPRGRSLLRAVCLPFHHLAFVCRSRRSKRSASATPQAAITLDGIRTHDLHLERVTTTPLVRQGAKSSGRRGSRTLKAHRSSGFGPGAVANRLALPFTVWMAGFEPAISGFRRRRIRPGFPTSRNQGREERGEGREARPSTLPSHNWDPRDSNPHLAG